MRPRVALAATAFVLGATFCWQAPPLGHEASPAPLSSDLVQALTAEPGPTPNDDLAFGEMKVPRWLAETVVRAAQATNVDPAYMMALADKESSLLPDNKARTSSAEGLFQFVETTWLEVLRRYGPKHGYAIEAEAIQIVQGRPVVSDDKDREQ